METLLLKIRTVVGRGRDSIVDHDELPTIIEADPQKTTRQLAEVFNVDHATIARHLEQIGKVKKLDKWVPHELNEKQKAKKLSL